MNVRTYLSTAFAWFDSDNLRNVRRYLSNGLIWFAAGVVCCNILVIFLFRSANIYHDDYYVDYFDFGSQSVRVYSVVVGAFVLPIFFVPIGLFLT